MKTIRNVLWGVGTLSVSDKHSLAEWDKTYRMAGVYSAHLKKDGVGNDKSTRVQFNPTAHDVLWSRVQSHTTTFKYWERTAGGSGNWAQFELHFEQPDGNGWFDLSVMAHQHPVGIGWAQLVWDEYALLDAAGGSTDFCGFGGQTPDGTSVWVIPSSVTDAIKTVGDAGSVMKEFDDKEPGVGVGDDVANYVLTRVRMELWEAGGARETWIGDVTIDGHVYAIEPGSDTPGLELDSPNTTIGYTEDGVTVTYTADSSDVEVEEETFPIDRVLTKETLEVTCNMAESSLFNMDKAMAGSLLSGNVLKLGAGDIKKINLQVRGVNPAGYIRAIQMPSCTATGSVGMPYKKGEKTVIPVTFQALKTTGYPAVIIVDNAA